MSTSIQVKRVYEESSPEDGARVLVDRLWPRGISKEKASLTLWDKEVAPSTDLRKWYEHDRAKFEEFGRRYKDELSSGDQAEGYTKLKDLATADTLTLLTASKAVEISEATVLAHLLESGWSPNKGD